MNIFSKMAKSIRGLFSEYRQIKWPSLRMTISLSLFVIVVSAIITLMILGLDAFFFELRSRFIIS